MNFKLLPLVTPPSKLVSFLKDTSHLTPVNFSYLRSLVTAISLTKELKVKNLHKNMIHSRLSQEKTPLTLAALSEFRNTFPDLDNYNYRISTHRSGVVNTNDLVLEDNSHHWHTDLEHQFGLEPATTLIYSTHADHQTEILPATLFQAINKRKYEIRDAHEAGKLTLEESFKEMDAACNDYEDQKLRSTPEHILWFRNHDNFHHKSMPKIKGLRGARFVFIVHICS